MEASAEERSGYLDFSRVSPGELMGMGAALVLLGSLWLPWFTTSSENPNSQLPGGVSPATLESIAACESGGDPTAVSSDGSYRGKYQFDFGTWESVGGSGDPAAASEAEQDYRAALLYAQSGSSPWPI